MRSFKTTLYLNLIVLLLLAGCESNKYAGDSDADTGTDTDTDSNQNCDGNAYRKAG